MHADPTHLVTNRYHSEQSLRSLERTQALERDRRALFAEGAVGEPANGALNPS